MVASSFEEKKKKWFSWPWRTELNVWPFVRQMDSSDFDTELICVICHKYVCTSVDKKDPVRVRNEHMHQTRRSLRTTTRTATDNRSDLAMKLGVTPIDRLQSIKNKESEDKKNTATGTVEDLHPSIAFIVVAIKIEQRRWLTKSQ